MSQTVGSSSILLCWTATAGVWSIVNPSILLRVTRKFKKPCPTFFKALTMNLWCSLLSCQMLLPVFLVGCLIDNLHLVAKTLEIFLLSAGEALSLLSFSFQGMPALSPGESFVAVATKAFQSESQRSVEEPVSLELQLNMGRTSV